jgi:hypothetical protein
VALNDLPPMSPSVNPDVRDRDGAQSYTFEQMVPGGRTRGESLCSHHKVLVACAIEVRHRKNRTAQALRKGGRYTGRVRLAVVSN